jgi:hypothetical protein
MIKQTVTNRHKSLTFSTLEEARAQLHSDLGLTDEMIANREDAEQAQRNETKTLLEDGTGLQTVREFYFDSAAVNWFTSSKKPTRTGRIDAINAGWIITVVFEAV